MPVLKILEIFTKMFILTSNKWCNVQNILTIFDRFQTVENFDFSFFEMLIKKMNQKIFKIIISSS